MSPLLQDVVLALTRQRVRSLLILATFATGFASVLMTIAVVEGGRRAISKDLRSLGIDCVVCLNPLQVGWVKIGDGSGRKLDREDVASLRAELGSAVRAVIPFKMELAGVLELFRAKRSPTYMITTPQFANVLAGGMLAGRFLEDGDRTTDGITPVVLDEAFARELDTNPERMVGQEFDAARGGVKFRARVVGVMRDPISLRQQLGMFDSQAMARSISARRLEFKNIYLHLTDEAPSGVIVQAPGVDAVDSIADRTREFLKTRGVEPFFHVQKHWAEFLIEMVDRFSSLANFFWIVNLFVMLLLNSTIATLAIEERYPEIAIRRVEGATRAAVVLPLVAEGTLLALLALPLGYVLATWLLHALVEPALSWKSHLPAVALWGTGVLVAALGALTNLIPARRIAKLAPARVLAER